MSFNLKFPVNIKLGAILKQKVTKLTAIVIKLSNLS